MQAALLGRDRQPIPRHTVDYSPFDGIQIIISMYKFDGAEPGIDEAFRARRHARDAPERDLRDKAPLRCRGLETFIGGAPGAQKRRDVAEQVAAVGMEKQVEVRVVGDALEDAVCGKPLDGRAERIAALIEKSPQLAAPEEDPDRTYAGS